MGPSVQFKDKTYNADDDGFLENPFTWDESFSEGMADKVGISGGLTASHWDVINFIRDTFLQTGCCPPVYKTLKALKLRIKDLKALFPAGYLRGACKLAGLTYRAEHIHPLWLEQKGVVKVPEFLERKEYRVDAFGFLIDPSQWDEDFAIHKSEELKMFGSGCLYAKESWTDEHWKIIRYLRKRFQETGSVPTVYDTCQDNGIDILDLERLFPDGYHRGAVKLAGLHVI
jgi:tRNA 2-thiouridine synthesizing protein E